EKMAAIVQIRVENRSGRSREVVLKLGLQANITKSLTPWNNASPPCELDNLIELDEQRGVVRFSAKSGNAHSLQGVFPRPQQLTRRGLLTTIALKAGEAKVSSYVNSVGGSAEQANSLYDSLITNVESELEKVKGEWNRELRAVFTPGNDRYSGFMPTLHTSDSDILKLYHTGIL